MLTISIKSLVTILSCILAASAVATPDLQNRASENVIEKRAVSDRIHNPLADFVDAAADAVADSIESIDANPDKTSDSGMDLKGFTVISSFTNAGVSFNTWQESSGADKRRWSRELENELEKRSTDIQGRFCATQCAYQNFTHADPNDCKSVYSGIYSTTGVFTLPTKQAMTVNSGNCAVVIINNSEQDVVYDYWDLAGTGQWLNGDCVIKGATVGVCLYSGIGSTVQNGVYTSVNHPKFYSS